MGPQGGGSSSVKNMIPQELDNNNQLETLLDTGRETVQMIYSVNDQMSPLEIIYQSIIALDKYILGLSIICLNIYILRYLFRNYGPILSQKLKKINIKKIVDNYLNYNYA